MMNVLQRLPFLARCFDMGFHQNPQITSEKATRFKAKRDTWYFMSVSLYNPSNYLSLITKFQLTARVMGASSGGQDDLWLRVKGNSTEWHNALPCEQTWKKSPCEMVFAWATSAAKWFNKTTVGSTVSSGAGRYFSYLTKIGNATNVEAQV